MSFYESSWFIDVLLYAIYALLAVAVAVVAWSLARTAPQRIGRLRALSVYEWLPGAVALGVFVVTMLLCWAVASTAPLTINGRPYTDAFWLGTADVLINSSLVLILVAALCVGFGASGLGRKIK